MCDKLREGNMTQRPPKSAYELLMEKKKRDGTNMWFIEEHCPECGSPVYTDGKLQWCSKNCINFEKRGKKDKDGFGFISDLIR